MKKTRIIILIITILSIFLITGISFLVVIFSVKYLISKPKIKLLKVLKILTTPILSIIAIILVIYFIISKINSNVSTSGATHIDDFRAGYLAWKNNYLFSNGYGNANANANESFLQYFSSFRLNNTGFSNSMMYTLAEGGIYLFLFYLIALLKFVGIQLKKKNIKFTFMVITIFILYIIVIIPHKLLVLYFISFA